MFGKIAAFELRYQLTSVVFWVSTVLFFFLSWAIVASDNVSFGGIGAVHENSPFTLGIGALIWSVYYMFVTTAFVANVVVRDDETGYGPIVRATPIGKFNYLIGRFTGAWIAASIGFLAIPLGTFVGSFMPWLDAETLGPFRIGDYLYAYFLLGLPGVLLTSALFFTIATVTRSMMLSYVAAVAFLVAYFVATGTLGNKPEFELATAYAEPFGLGAFGYVTKYWTVAEKNAHMPAFAGVLLVNRALCVLLSLLLLALGYWLYRFDVRGAKLKKHQKLKALADKEVPTPPKGPLPKPQFGAASALRQTLLRTRFETGMVFKSPAYLILIAIGLTLSLVSVFLSGEIFGTSVLPVTRFVIGSLQGNLQLIAMVIATYYAGELVWRERDRKMNEIVGAAAISDWALIFPKMFALLFVMVSVVLIGVVGGVAVQAMKGYTNFEIGKYLLWYALPMSVDCILLAVLATFFAAVAPHKFIGWGLMLVFIISTQVMSNLGLEHNLYQYASGPGVPLTDMNGMGDFWKGSYWFKAYWSAFAVLLLILSYGLWRRGTEMRLSARMKRLPRLLKGPAGVVAAAAVLVFVGTGAFIFVNTNVWNEYRTRLGQEKLQADYEKAALGLNGRKLAGADYEKAVLALERMPQPTVTAVKLDVDLDPHAPRMVTKGTYELVNQTAQPLTEVHLRYDPDLKLARVDLPGSSLDKRLEKFSHRIYRLTQPMQPGEHRTLSFESVAEQRGFKNSGNTTRLVDNGTFISSGEFTPSIGFSRNVFLQERSRRKKYGLKPELHLPVLSDEPAERTKNYLGGDWVSADITVTTVADQTPIAPGYKVSDETKGGRRTARFVTRQPILQFFSIQSARYAEKHRNYKGTDLVVYYDPQHPYNVDRMLTALERSLDYYTENFSPYQFSQARITEFPDYAQYAQSFPNTFAWSEGLGFIADVKDKEKIDYVTYVAAHEFGHQWWAHQVIGAEMEGETTLSETLAQYSALMVMERMYGPSQIRKFLKFELDRYLRGRGSDRLAERSLMRNENQQYIHYRKGSVVMYLLKDEIGEEAVNRAVRRVLAQYAYKGAPFPNSRDLVRALRAEAPADKQELILDLFARITIWDLKTTALTYKKRKDGKFDVTMTVTARKLYGDEKGKETEAPLGADETFDVGLFTAEPGKKNFGQSSVQVFERRKLKSGTQTFTFVTDKAPKFGGVDPYNKRIDRDSDDNVRAASAATG
jgi:aminopeptidase N